MSYDLRLALMTGIDIPIVECGLTIHQPTIKEISYVGEEDFLTGVQVLCLNKTSFTQDETLLTTLNNFQIFMMIMQDKESVDKRQAVEAVFPILFPDYKVAIMVKSLVFMKRESDDIITIDEGNFNYIQEVLKKICCINSSAMQSAGFNPANDKAREIANKLMRGRQKVAAEKGENSNGSIFTQYVSMVAIGIPSMSLADTLLLTMFQLFDLIERYSLWTAWDIDIRVRLAGGSSEKQPDNWMKNIH